MPETRTIELHRGGLKFSAGHFTIFSATEREKLHGHNYFVEVAITAEIGEPGILFDYRIFKKQLKQLCDQLNQRFLLPSQSPYLQLEEDEHYCYAHFNQQKIPFLKEDVLILPLSNITLEELSTWFVEQVTSDQAFIQQYGIHALTLKVYNGMAHSATATWQLKR